MGVMSSHHIKATNHSGRTDQRLDHMPFQDIRTLVCQTELLRGLSAKACDAILAAGRIQHVPAKTYLFHQEDRANHCFVLLSGEIRLFLLAPDGKRVIFDIIGPGMQLGFFVALSEKQYPISAETIEHADLYVWDAAIMRSLALTMPRLTMNALSVLTDRVICLQNKVQQLSTERVEQRIAHSLLMLAQRMGNKQDEGILITMPLTHRDLAELSGTNIYSVSRVLHKWEEEDIIITGRKRVILRHPDRLRNLISNEV